MQLAAEETSNFLIPNGTIFVEAIIFLIVLAVIWFFVVPPVKKVLEAREEMLEQTSKDSKAAAKGFADADADYQAGLKSARTEAGGIRDEARAQARGEMDREKAAATAEADGIAAEQTAALRAEGDAASEAAHRSVAGLSSTLASKILGFDVSTKPGLAEKFEQAAAARSTSTSGTVS